MRKTFIALVAFAFAITLFPTIASAAEPAEGTPQLESSCSSADVSFLVPEPADRSSYYCGQCILYCGEEPEEIYYISPGQCCNLGMQCGGSEWWPWMCHGGEFASIC